MNVVKKDIVNGLYTGSEGVGTDQAGLPSFPLVEICKLQETKISVSYRQNVLELRLGNMTKISIPDITYCISRYNTPLTR